MKPKTITQVARLGGLARWANIPPEARAEIMRKTQKARRQKAAERRMK